MVYKGPTVSFLLPTTTSFNFLRSSLRPAPLLPCCEIMTIFPSRASVLAMKDGCPSSLKNKESGNCTSQPSRSMLGGSKYSIKVENGITSFIYNFIFLFLCESNSCGFFICNLQIEQFFNLSPSLWARHAKYCFALTPLSSSITTP